MSSQFSHFLNFPYHCIDSSIVFTYKRATGDNWFHSYFEVFDPCWALVKSWRNILDKLILYHEYDGIPSYQVEVHWQILFTMSLQEGHSESRFYFAAWGGCCEHGSEIWNQDFLGVADAWMEGAPFWEIRPWSWCLNYTYLLLSWPFSAIKLLYTNIQLGYELRLGYN